MKTERRIKSDEKDYITKICKERKYDNGIRDYFLATYEAATEDRTRAIFAECHKCLDYPYRHKEAVQLCDQVGCALHSWRHYQKYVYVDNTGKKLKYGIRQPQLKESDLEKAEQEQRKLEGELNIPEEWFE